MSIYYSGDN